MKLRYCIALGSLGILAFSNTGCVVRQGGLRVYSPPPPPPPPVHRPAEVVIVRPAPPPVQRQTEVIVVKPTTEVVVAPRHPAVHPTIVRTEPPVSPPPVVVVTPPGHAETPPGHAQTPPGHTRIPPGQAKKQAEPAGRPVVVFTSQEREVICTHFKHANVTVAREAHGRGHKGVPPGQAKKAYRRDNLPPEWEQRCVVGAVIPQEVYRQCEPLPQEVVVKLPPPPPDTIVVTIDTKIFRLARASLEILDVFNAL